jgi:exodeoxyribonuclease V alpha subunit
MNATVVLTPDLEWFVKRWNLPKAAIPFVSHYLDAERGGSTAFALPGGMDAAFFADAAAIAAAGADAPVEPKPLVVVRTREQLFLQSWRNYKAELEIAKRLRNRLKGGFDAQYKPKRLKELFPGSHTGDLQIKAAEVALRNRLTLVTGGPGAGKTHTLVRILAILVEQGIGASKIRLAAPTGKAADRMKKAVAESLENLPADFQPRIDDLRTVAGKSSTLHSLMGYNPSTGKCKYNEAHPLPCEVLIVDECSMVDVLLWRALLEATPENARLILVGDPNQLESVGQGSVLAELVRVAKNINSPLHSVWVHLTEARRFKDRRGILALATALENLDADEAVKLLSEAKEDSAATGIAWLEISGSTLSWSEFPEVIRNALTAVAEADTPEAALLALSRICILTAQREYFVGSKAMSEAMERHFAATGSRTPNQPIIINQNDPETGLRNGSVGIIATGPDGIRRGWFPGLGGDRSFQQFSIARLPDYSPAWALTIHRSQGSEFDEVLVILPRQESPMTTRELIYTAITRARKTVYIAGDLESIRKAAANPSNRVTMVGAHLDFASPTL